MTMKNYMKFVQYVKAIIDKIFTIRKDSSIKVWKELNKIYDLSLKFKNKPNKDK